MICELIVYVCPKGILAHQLETYFDKSRSCCSPNAAHNYMPHCSLTGFFRDQEESIPGYLTHLNRAYDAAVTRQPQSVMVVIGLEFHGEWHGLILHSPWLKQLILDFIQQASSPTRAEPIRPKDWLHLSLAYEFSPDQANQLQAIAQDLITPTAPVHWELRFYRRHPDNHWTCYQQWELP